MPDFGDFRSEEHRCPKNTVVCDQPESCDGSRYYGTDETGTDSREGEFRRGSGTGSEEIRGRIR